MKKAILGTKIGIGEGGKVIPVTAILAGPCTVVQKKTVETDGYNAVQVGYGDIKEKNVNKPLKGHFAKANTANKRYLREFRLEDIDSINVGGSHSKRVSGSMGMCSFPGRVFKGKKLPGHYGVDKVTIQNLEVVKVDAEQNLILVKGAVPGVKGGLITIRNAVKA